MQKLLSLLPEILILFEGEGGAEGASGETAQAAAEQTGEMQSAAGSNDTPEIDPEERTKAWRDLINNEYKDLYDADMQKIAKNRVAKMKEQEQQIAAQQDVIDRLSAKYGVTDLGEIAQALDNDTSMWEAAADEAGLTVPQYMQLQNLQRQNAQLIRQEQARYEQAQKAQQMQAWAQQEQEVRAKYPGFSLDAEAANPQFLNMLKAGVPMDHAYEVIHLNEINQQVARTAAQQTEKAVTDNIRSRGMRPAENGTQQNHGAFTTTNDIHNLSLEQMRALNKRARSGEFIDFKSTY